MIFNSATNIIKGLIVPIINNGTEPTAIEGVNREEEAKLTELAKEVKEKTE